MRQPRSFAQSLAQIFEPLCEFHLVRRWRGERTLRNVEDVGAVLHRLVTDAPGLMRSILRGGARPDGGSGREAGGV